MLTLNNDKNTHIGVHSNCCTYIFVFMRYIPLQTSQGMEWDVSGRSEWGVSESREGGEGGGCSLNENCLHVYPVITSNCCTVSSNGYMSLAPPNSLPRRKGGLHPTPVSHSDTHPPDEDSAHLNCVGAGWHLMWGRRVRGGLHGAGRRTQSPGMESQPGRTVSRQIQIYGRHFDVFRMLTAYHTLRIRIRVTSMRRIQCQLIHRYSVSVFNPLLSL